MGRPPVIPVETKTRVVLAVLSGEVSVAEAARKEKMSEQSIHRWRIEFVEAGRPPWPRERPARRLARRSWRPGGAPACGGGRRTDSRPG